MEVFVISCRCCYLGFATVAILVFLSATAGAGVVSSYFGGGFYRFGALLRSIGLCAVVLLRASYLLFLGTIPAVILSCFGCCGSRIGICPRIRIDTVLVLMVLIISLKSPNDSSLKISSGSFCS